MCYDFAMLFFVLGDKKLIRAPIGKNGNPMPNASPCSLCCTSNNPPIIAPIPVTNNNTTPNFAQPVVTTFQSINPDEIEQSPQQRKNMVSNHLCLPKAYSLTILKLGLNSGLVKCNVSRHRMDITPKAIVLLRKLINYSYY
jgi:hypothetical protein